MISNERFSKLVGSIFDCVIDTDRWPETMQEICAEIDCALSAILLLEMAQPRLHFFKVWNIDSAWQARYAPYVPDMVLLYQADPATLSRPIDEPMVLSRNVPEGILQTNRLYQEWARPQGVIDSLQTVVLREPARMGVFAANRHESVGVAADREINILRLLAPHIRRAVTISDLMDLKSMERHALAATLDACAAGVIVVAHDQRVVHANQSAERMFTAGEPVCSINGRLTARNAAANGRLAEAISLAQRNESRIGTAGIGVALTSPCGEPAVAHVLPLAQGDLRTRLVPQAVAAVFVTQASGPAKLDVAAIAGGLGLTRAEARLLAQLAAGATLTAAAAALGIAATTAKTHLSHSFAKAGVSRLADLIALVHRLAHPSPGRNDDQQ